MTSDELRDKHIHLFPWLGNEEHAYRKRIECEKGWYLLLDKLCNAINKISKSEKLTEGNWPFFTNIDEKYGMLNIHLSTGGLQKKSALKKVYKLIDDAEFKSQFVCEICGKPGKLREERSWIKANCDACDKVYHKR